MKTIGIELNHVVRNINKQILRYYQKGVDPSLDIDDLDDRTDVFEKYAKFDSKMAKYNFTYIDYPYELFGCAPTMEKGLSAKITMWLSEITNIEDDEVRVIFYSMNEEELTIQSTYFFLSKIGTRVRKVIFPRKVSEVWDECDVVVTANPALFEDDSDNKGKIVLINRDFNEKYKEKAFLNYDNLSEIIDDNDFFKKIGFEHEE